MTANVPTLNRVAATLIAAHPHLTPNPRDDSNIAATNLRSELRRVLPGVKFRAKQSRGAGCSSVRIVLPTDVTEAHVTAARTVANRFQEGHFDGMTDSYEYRINAWTDAFGGFRYVFVSIEWDGGRVLREAA